MDHADESMAPAVVDPTQPDASLISTLPPFGPFIVCIWAIDNRFLCPLKYKIFPIGLLNLEIAGSIGLGLFCG